MATVKIAHNSPSHANPSELEQGIAQALYDLESQVSDLKSALRPLQFASAKEVSEGIAFWRSLVFWEQKQEQVGRWRNWRNEHEMR